MKNYLMVPIRLDALVVQSEALNVVSQNADFTILPYFEDTFKEGINGDTANISESIVSQPFQNKNLHLGKGIHLHWALPDALTRGDHTLNFPQVPDRWLITRKKKKMTDKQWIVESNYLFPPNISKKGKSVNIPFNSLRWIYNETTKKYEYKPNQDNDPNAKRSAQHYRYMGRSMTLAAWKAHLNNPDPNTEYYPNLTAIGYGSPTFAAFYPNCFSVFGFHDPDPGDNLTNIQYEIAGWYSNPSEDTLSKFITSYRITNETNINPDIKTKLQDLLDTEFKSRQAFIRELRKKLSETETDTHLTNILNEAKFNNNNHNKETIQEKFNWKIPENDPNPDQMLCYAGISFSVNTVKDNPEKDSNIAISVANTPTEALSARMADILTEDKDQLKTIEDQLEAMQLAFRLNEKKLDTITRFKELRYENGFTPVDSGRLWTIRKENASETAENSNPQDAELGLPEHIAPLLSEVNLLQKQYNKARQEIDRLRTQLFADWYKYMICVYPPDISIHDYPSSDLVKYFIRSKIIKPLNQKTEAAGKTGEFTTDENGNITAANIADGSSPRSIAWKLTEKINQLIAAIESFEDEANTENETPVNYYIVHIPGPRYWKPNNPVVLVEGNAAKPTQRHGKDGLLSCPVFQSQDEIALQINDDFKALLRKIYTNLNSGSKDLFSGLSIWKNQPWNPFKLEWQAQLFPSKGNGNLQRRNGVYDPHFITDNYQASVLNPDLELKQGKGNIIKTGNIYSGSNILTAQAGLLLKNIIENKLTEEFEVFEQVEDINANNYNGEKVYTNPVYTMIRTYEELKGRNFLAQSLNGFNQALLMHKQTMELSIDDPLGFNEYKDFTGSHVKKAMGNRIKIAPAPLNAFNPIRSGALKLLRLRLVDTFGQPRDLDVNKIDTTYKMTSPTSQYLIKLPPRLVQPARLGFRWLNAGQDTQETNAHQATTPVCGWLLTNKTDKSIVFYDTQGKALGYFKAGRWREAIDSNQAMQIQDIQNPHLKRVAEYIETAMQQYVEAMQNKLWMSEDEKRSKFIEHFIGTIDDALHNIQPEQNTAYPGPALLTGRPVAVVRAMLNLELYGAPAVNQNWNVFRKDMAQNKRTTDSFTKVQFPVRLGEYGQLNDGLVGYWLEKQDRDGNISFATETWSQQGNIVFTEGNKFYSPQSDYIDSEAIESRYNDNGPINFYQSIADAPQTLTMLMDPRGSVHATAGVLPNKAISIPEEQYAAALQHIEVSFLHAPLLTRKGKIELPLRTVSDYEWSWVEQVRDAAHNTGWKEFFPENRMEKQLFIREWNKASYSETGSELWDHLLTEEVNWLAPVDDDEDGQTDTGMARIPGKDQRKQATLDGSDFAGQEELIAYILDTHSTGIDPVVNEAVFAGEQQMKEGWLKLRKAQNKT